MKILFINYEYPPLGGGGGHHSRSIAMTYAQAGHEVYFLTAGWNRFGLSREHGFTVNRINTGRRRTHICTSPEMLEFVIKAWHELGTVLKEQSFDRVHIFFGVPTGLLIFHPGLRKAHNTIWAFGSDVPWHNKERFWLLYLFLTPVIKSVWRRATALVCNSDDLRSEILAVSPELDVKVIYNGIDTASFRPVEPPRPEHPFTILCAGRLIPLKRTELVIKAAALLKNSGHALRVRIAGEGAERSGLENLARGLGLADSVEFLGALPREQMPEIYRSADVFTHMSRTEGMCNAILEAMATGLPLIASDTGDAAALLQNCGTLLPDSTPETCAAAILRYLTDPALRCGHGKAAREAAERMSWEQSAPKYLALLSN